MIGFIIGFILGSLMGIFMMCLVQINKNEEKE